MIIHLLTKSTHRSTKLKHKLTSHVGTTIKMENEAGQEGHDPKNLFLFFLYIF